MNEFRDPFYYEPMYHGYGIFRTADRALVQRCHTLQHAQDLVWQHTVTHRDPSFISRALSHFLDAGGGVVVAWLLATCVTLTFVSLVLPFLL